MTRGLHSRPGPTPTGLRSTAATPRRTLLHPLQLGQKAPLLADDICARSEPSDLAKSIIINKKLLNEVEKNVYVIMAAPRARLQRRFCASSMARIER